MVQIVQLGVVIFNTGLKPKSIWVQKDWLERWWSILYIYAIFPKVPNFFDKVFSKSTHPPLLKSISLPTSQAIWLPCLLVSHHTGT